MEFVIAVFSIRTDTIQFNNFLNKNGVRSSVVETPKSASVSCGISVKFSLSDLSKVKRLLTYSGTKSFVKFYLLNNLYNRNNLTPIK